ncbi:GNAT family protein [Burkholderia gladioli pv. gladioli]|uniref:Acetyltransferase domain protein n=1 Tax=Burkholderia gladioli TaxID=28095 RepID=A0A095F336_BURGA|nr:GNAT family protein [Burkholderia gladioli]AJW99043.1 acetyltransferase domain protein [Burkholderia gladioli]ASD80056.1 N-acetyltransferase [Burkholderia gladioli pv. gladioli]AWY54696.1 N-acetyltransferase [Burkholderia gladioli pv. gladioli]KGC11400.1 acetyltransferase domain protein [Burkholderia gladioli]MDJ1160342.1 GNAT family protein [Burkholderia gladioli pv. gladioli]
MNSEGRTQASAHQTEGPGQTGRGSGSCWLREPGSNDVNDIAAWLTEPDINQWFDFGQGRQTLPVLAVQLMVQSARHRLRVFGPAGHEAPSGVVAVSDLTHAFGTGSFWVLRDSRRPTCPDMTFVASVRLLHEVLETDRLHCITAWAADCNARSRRLLERIGFHLIGLQRDCHVMRGWRFGRVLYDLLPGDLANDCGSAEGDA